MVKKFLKIAGVKTEAEFYKKYPSEDAFFKAHPEAKELKQYKQGGQQKKLNQLTSFDGDIDNIIPTAQRGRKTGFGCKGDSKCITGSDKKKKDGISDSDGGGMGNYVPMSNAPVTWDELQKYSVTDPNSKEFKARLKSLQKQFSGLTAQQLLAASGDSDRIGRVMVNPLTKQSDIPSWDKQKTPYDKAWYDFYRPLMNKPTKVTVPEILQQQPGGFGNYEQNVRSNYGRPKAQNGEAIGSYTGGEEYTTPNFVDIERYNDYYNSIVGDIKPLDESATAPIMGNVDGLTNMLKGMGGSGGDAGSMKNIGAAAAGVAGAKKGKKVRKAQNGMNDCGEGMMFDMSTQNCVPDPYYVSPNSAQPAQTNNAPENFDYEEQQKFNVNPNLSGQTARTGPGTGVNPVADVANSSSKSSGSGKASSVLPNYNYQYKPKTAAGRYLQSAAPALGVVGLGYKVFDMARQSKQAKREAEQRKDISGLTLQASLSQADQQQRKYVRPEDALIQPEQMFPTYGVGTNVLTARDGMQIGGNPTEIQNMYNPGDLYQDLGYEPLDDSNIVKQYAYGGMTRAQNGYQSVWGSAAEQGGQQAGKVAGQALGSAIGVPGIGGALGEAVGRLGGAQMKLIAESLDKNAKETNRYNELAMRNVRQAAMNSAGQAIRSNYSNFVKNGGWVSNDWLPQVITKFGEHDVKDLLREDPMMDTLRTGGHISQNKMFPTDQYGLGGELKTTWGGYAETMSQNPYLPGTGETVMFRGNSHEEADGKGRTGIGVNYGGNDEYSPYMEYGRDGIEDKTHVEVERGEPAIEMMDGSGEKNMVVFGNLKIPNSLLNEIGDPNAKGKKFKTYTAGLSKKEDKINKSLEKDMAAINRMKVETPFDKLKMDALQANIIGKNMKLKGYADFKMNAAAVQSGLNDTAEEYGVDADALAKGKIKIDKKAQNEMAKYGKEIFRAQAGTSIPPTATQAQRDEVMALYREARAEADRGNKNSAAALKLQEKFHEYFPEFAMEVILDSPTVTKKAKKMGIKTVEDLKKQSRDVILDTNKEGWFGPRTEQYISRLKRDVPKAVPIGKKAELKTVTGTPKPFPERKEIPKKRFPYEDYINEAIAAVRPSDVDYSTDIYPEMMALSMNQLEPVDAQLYQPQLLTPYDVSYQDQLNEITAQTRAAERMAGMNPAAASIMSAEADRRKNSVLAQQFRDNQAQRMGVYNQNIATLNDAQMKNLAILDEQAKRQAMARSNTKAQALEAAKSISDKIAKNKLENKTLQVYENLYNYRFDPSGRAINYNPLAKFDYTAKPGTAQQPIMDGYEWQMVPKKKKKDDDDTGRNGRIVKAMKGL